MFGFMILTAFIITVLVVNKRRAVRRSAQPQRTTNTRSVAYGNALAADLLTQSRRMQTRRTYKISDLTSHTVKVNL